MDRRIIETPERLVERGCVNFGFFKTPFRNLNILEADISPKGNSLPLWWKRFRLKEWQHFGIICKDYFFGFALIDAKLMGVSWFYLFDRNRNTLVQHNRNTTATNVTLSSDLWNNQCSFSAGSYNIGVHNYLESHCHEIEIDIGATRKLPSVSGHLTIHQDPAEVQPLISVIPVVHPTRPFYSHKVPCPVEGTITFDQTTVTLNRETDLAILDIHKVFYPYRTWWNWATFAGHDREGNLLAANLTQNIIDDEKYENENTIWYKNTLSLLGGSRFEVPKNYTDPWEIRTTDGRVELTFTPQGERKEKINLLVFVSEYHQPFGLFNGTMVDDSGRQHEVKDLFGVTEHHIVTW